MFWGIFMSYFEEDPTHKSWRDFSSGNSDTFHSKDCKARRGEWTHLLCVLCVGKLVLRKPCISDSLLSSSQGLGESGMFLGSSVLFAIYDAVTAARKERGLTKTFSLNSPATPEWIRMTCVDQFTDMVRVVEGCPSYNHRLMDFHVLSMDLVIMTKSQGRFIFSNENSHSAYILQATANLLKWWLVSDCKEKQTQLSQC